MEENEVGDIEIEIGHINIRVTNDNVEYDTEFSVTEVVFWLETLKTMVLRQVIDDTI